MPMGDASLDLEDVRHRSVALRSQSSSAHCINCPAVMSCLASSHMLCSSSLACRQWPDTTMKSLCSRLFCAVVRIKQWYTPIFAGVFSRHTLWSLKVYCESVVASQSGMQPSFRCSMWSSLDSIVRTIFFSFSVVACTSVVSCRKVELLS